MAPRAYWKGTLKLSLVTCPVALYPATTAVEKTRFHMINTETGNRLRQQMVDEKTGDVVESGRKAVAPLAMTIQPCLIMAQIAGTSPPRAGDTRCRSRSRRTADARDRPQSSVGADAHRPADIARRS